MAARCSREFVAVNYHSYQEDDTGNIQFILERKKIVSECIRKFESEISGQNNVNDKLRCSICCKIINSNLDLINNLRRSSNL